MPKKEKKFNVKDHVDDNTCDLNLAGLSEVPVKQIAFFKRVTILDLSSNKLVTLGNDFSTLLKRLVKIDLSKNQIESLPDDFGLLTTLRHLDCYDNKIEHLPLSFGDLKQLRYLDLKNNPLAPALAKVVGMCLTTKDCHDSARQTVKFLGLMQEEAKRAKKDFRPNTKEIQPVAVTPIGGAAAASINAVDNEVVDKNQSPTGTKQKSKHNKKNKKKKGGNGGGGANNGTNGGANNENQPNGTNKNNNNNNNNTHKNHNNHNNNHNTKKNGNAVGKQQQNGSEKSVETNQVKDRNNVRPRAKRVVRSTTTALSTILIFLFLLSLNFLIIYLVRYRKPSIADVIVESISPQYRDWMMSKSEFLRLRVTDWITEFSTPPEEN